MSSFDRFQTWLKNVVLALGVACFLLMFALVSAGDRRSTASLYGTDYITALYVAGHMVADGRGADIYPPLTAETFWHEKFALYARKLLEAKGDKGLFLFTYPPIVALVVSPFCSSTAINSLICWQVISLLSLLASAFIFCLSPGVRASPWRVFFSSFLFFPMLNVFVTGQTSLVIGLLPLTAGYSFWQRKKPFLAGLCFAVLGVKPQVMIPVVVAAGGLALLWILKRLAGKMLPEKFYCPMAEREILLIGGGVIVCLVAIHSFAAFFLGFQSFVLWLHSVHMSSETFGRQDTGYWQYHLFISLPCIMILALPRAYWQAARLPSYITGIVMLLAGIILSARIALLPLPEDSRRDIMLIVGVIFMLLTAPHLLIYDACLFLLCAWIIFFRFSDRQGMERTAANAARLLWLAFNIYFAMLLSPGEVPAVGWQVGLLLIVTFCLVRFLAKVFAEPVPESV